MLDGVLGDGDAAGPQPPRQGGDEAARRIARQRGDEVVDWSAQPAAFAWSTVMVSTGRSSIQLVPFHRCGQSLAIASASA